jgi:hypothetical protein
MIACHFACVGDQLTRVSEHAGGTYADRRAHLRVRVTT